MSSTNVSDSSKWYSKIKWGEILKWGVILYIVINIIHFVGVFGNWWDDSPINDAFKAGIALITGAFKNCSEQPVCDNKMNVSQEQCSDDCNYIGPGLFPCTDPDDTDDDPEDGDKCGTFTDNVFKSIKGDCKWLKNSELGENGCYFNQKGSLCEYPPGVKAGDGGAQPFPFSGATFGKSCLATSWLLISFLLVGLFKILMVYVKSSPEQENASLSSGESTESIIKRSFKNANELYVNEQRKWDKDTSPDTGEGMPPEKEYSKIKDASSWWKLWKSGDERAKARKIIEYVELVADIQREKGSVNALIESYNKQNDAVGFKAGSERANQYTELVMNGRLSQRLSEYADRNITEERRDAFIDIQKTKAKHDIVKPKGE
jgi:hypothetical protein